jgi:hypothetical protein
LASIVPRALSRLQIETSTPKPVWAGVAPVRMPRLARLPSQARIGVSCYEAGEILARLRARFRRFEEFTATVIDHAGHVACILAERRGIKVVAPVHDAIMAEGPVKDIKDVSLALDRIMRDASAVVLQGYALATDEKITKHTRSTPENFSAGRRLSKVFEFLWRESANAG